MHLEILVEDQSGKKFLDLLVPNLVGKQHTFRVLPYKGIGRIPKDLAGKADPGKRLLLNELPRLLRGYGQTFANYSQDSPAAVVIVCDLDDRCQKNFRRELFDILSTCRPKPGAYFCFAIEEGEAWFLGDILAVKKAYPKAKDAVLNAYNNDSICGTWEKLADAVYPGGAQALSKKGWQAVGAEKSKWAENIAPHMDIENNQSPSFRYFREKVRSLL